MMADQILNATGTITKEEELISIEHSVLPDTLVLESSRPYPGYHGHNVPENIAPSDIYLITKTRYDGEDILRKSKKIKKTLKDRFDVSFGHAEIHSQTLHFIRLKNLDCFDCIDRIQQAFKKEDIVFCRKKRIKGEALINIQRLFSLKKVAGHIFRNLDNPSVYYFEIPCKPKWDTFKKITYYIRGNIDKYSFDAAIGAIYLKELHDIIRIYSPGLTVDQLELIRDKYLYEFEHPDHLGCA